MCFLETIHDDLFLSGNIDESLNHDVQQTLAVFLLILVLRLETLEYDPSTLADLLKFLLLHLSIFLVRLLLSLHQVFVLHAARQDQALTLLVTDRLPLLLLRLLVLGLVLV